MYQFHSCNSKAVVEVAAWTYFGRGVEAELNALERFRNITAGRETKMIRLKEGINELLVQLVNNPKYKVVDKQGAEENNRFTYKKNPQEQDK